MIVVVDTNILFSFFWQDSLIRRILMSKNIEFFSPELAIDELKRYSSSISKKTKLSKEEFNDKIVNLKSFVKFIPKKDFSSFIQEAEKIAPDKDDIDFLSLCLKLNAPLWSNDNELKKQNKIIVFDIKDIIELYLD